MTIRKKKVLDPKVNIKSKARPNLSSSKKEKSAPANQNKKADQAETVKKKQVPQKQEKNAKESLKAPKNQKSKEVKKSTELMDSMDFVGHETTRSEKFIQKSEALSIILALQEKPDPQRIKNKDTNYILVWTNRVALWWFFRRFIEPMAKQEPEFEKKIKFYIAGIAPELIRDNLSNPFERIGQEAFPLILNAWMPTLQFMAGFYAGKTRNGRGLYDELLSRAHLTFLHVLEKQAMSIIGSSYKAQGIPFSDRLQKALQTAMRNTIAANREAVAFPSEILFSPDAQIRTVSIDDENENLSGLQF
jgi:hypothetical protein